MSEPPSFRPEHSRRRPTGEQAHRVTPSGVPQRRSIQPRSSQARSIEPHAHQPQSSQPRPVQPSSIQPGSDSNNQAPSAPTPPPSFAPRRQQHPTQPSPTPPAQASQYQAGQPAQPTQRAQYPSQDPHYPAQQSPGFPPQAAPQVWQPVTGHSDPRVTPTQRNGARDPAQASQYQAPRAFYPRSRGVPTPPPQLPPSQPPALAPQAPFRPRKKRHWGRRFFVFLLLVVVALAAWAAFLITDANRHLGRTTALGQTSSADGTTYLIAGSDSRADGAVQDNTEGQRADSIMVVNVAPNGQASAVSIPRDTYVEIPDYGWNKINASYSFGGDALLVTTVEHLTGLTVDHYVEVGMGGVADIVDAVGGINLCYDQTVSDEFSGLNWEAGCHDTDGATALAFSRMRYSDPLGDIGRADRQRQVVTKAVSKAMSPATLINPVSALRLERAGSGALTVDQDSSVLDIGRLALAFKSASANGMTGAPPIENLGYATGAGSVVLLEDTTAPDFFTRLKSGQLATSDFASLGQ